MATKARALLTHQREVERSSAGLALLTTWVISPEEEVRSAIKSADNWDLTQALEPTAAGHGQSNASSTAGGGAGGAWWGRGRGRTGRVWRQRATQPHLITAIVVVILADL